MFKTQAWIALLFLAAVAWLAYAPGLGGGFLFDDFANLPQLGAYGPVDNSTTLLRYLTSGNADPTGRPVAVASFLLDTNNWPAEPYAFKRTNLIIHLLNGGLLAWLLMGLARERHLPAKVTYMGAVVGAGLWLLHPLLVSTTLYIVQREAMLPATFSLLGLLGYLHGRGLLLKGSTWTGTAVATGSIALATLLATLSKANGVLLPILTLVLETTLLRQPAPRSVPALTQIRLWVLGLPSGLLLVYLFLQLPTDLGTIPSGRTWSYGQRLLTEPRVLLEYLHLLWFPKPFTNGLFNDQVIASASLLNPWTTLPALILVIILPLTAWLLRLRFPLLAAAVLFYFAGHLLESTVIPLELYYEHRNYLPAMLMFWPLACWLVTPDRYFKYKIALGLSLVVMLAGMTYLRSSLWGNTTEQALFWAEINPESPRAIAYAAQFQMQLGHPVQAEQRLRNAIIRHPDETQLTINLLGARCQQGSISRDDLALAAHSLQTMRTGTGLLFNWFNEAILWAQAERCEGLDFTALQSLLDAAWRNPSIAGLPGRRQDLLHLQGSMALAQRNEKAALFHFNAALDADDNPAIGLKQAALLGSAGFPCEGLRHLDRYSSIRPPERPFSLNMAALHFKLLKSQGYWSREAERLRSILQDDITLMKPSGCQE
jgi:protein O-mannosyl-transferase